jgi:hypothetical protein
MPCTEITLTSTQRQERWTIKGVFTYRFPLSRQDQDTMSMLESVSSTSLEFGWEERPSVYTRAVETPFSEERSPFSSTGFLRSFCLISVFRSRRSNAWYP